ncbi:hypothetical protein MESS2_p90022 [Mesorhizobium metallidurans STM 2683]|uniref:Uncharacterized protein n=1 Tax=Mesorhizobium metallidurans STM 2683 TaxID=1297569 RepID=M5EZV5_9HYPH|nr:hypothetical protein MESS2_p90022 [Mesorhizobium metallidurans STM 2683]
MLRQGTVPESSANETGGRNELRGRALSSRPHSAITTMRKARIALAHRLVIIMQNWMTAPIVGVDAEGLVRDGREHSAMRPFHGDRQSSYSLAPPQRLFYEGGAEGPRQADTAGSRSWFSNMTRWPTSFLRAMINAQTACAAATSRAWA